MKTLPEEYLVICSTPEETNEVYDFAEGRKSSRHHSTVTYNVVVSPKYKGRRYESDGEYEGKMPRIKFSKWKSLINQETKMYTIEELKQKGLTVKCDTVEQANKLWKFFHHSDNANFGIKNQPLPYLFFFNYLGIAGWNSQRDVKHKSWDIPFSSIDFEEELVLPKSWHIIVTEENKEELSKWKGAPLKIGWVTGMYDWNKDKCSIEGIQKEHGNNPISDIDRECWGKEITTEQFRKYVAKSNKEMKKPIGYKAPFDLFGGVAPKGTLFIAVTGVSGVKEGSFYSFGEYAKTSAYSKHLPSEIVEQWEAVYKKEVLNLKIKSFSGEFNVRISEDGIQAEGETIHPQSLEDIVNHSGGDDINSWKVDFSHVTIGCKKNIPITEIRRILQEWDKFNS